MKRGEIDSLIFHVLEALLLFDMTGWEELLIEPGFERGFKIREGRMISEI